MNSFPGRPPRAREPLRSPWFRRALWLSILATFLGVAWSWQATHFARRERESALARQARAHALDLSLVELSAAATQADAAAEVFLVTWRSSFLDDALATEDALRRRLADLRATSAADTTLAPELDTLDSLLAQRRENFAQLIAWARAGQFNRVREWSEAHHDAVRATVVQTAIDALIARQHRARAVETAAVAAASRRSDRVMYLSWTLEASLCALVAWLLWRYERSRQLVIMCAWSRTIQFEGEWLTFEQYLERRFGLQTSHGVRPEVAAQIDAEDRESQAHRP
ncbi:MAG: hypothetical protein KF715_18990 [Candidatus Didemnitutus sp.]|nr:hypothetical protein [Candidatus Didemnitutus sp.]